MIREEKYLVINKHNNTAKIFFNLNTINHFEIRFEESIFKIKCNDSCYYDTSKIDQVLTHSDTLHTIKKAINNIAKDTGREIPNNFKFTDIRW